MKDFRVIGKSLPRIDTLDKALGKTIYGYDMSLPGMLHAKVLRSTLPHAEILSVNVKEAKKIDGVEAILTASDIPDEKIGLFVRDYRVFARDKVRFIGDPIAAVAATTLEVAERALEAIEVKYKELPGVFDPQEAMLEGASQVHTEYFDVFAQGPREVKNNICATRTIQRGNIEKAFQESDLIVENVYTTPMVEHCHLEPNAALAIVDSSGKVTVWSNTQLPFFIRDNLAQAFRMPLSKIRVILTPIGGGFGGKSGVFMCEPYCMALALKTGKPVKMVTTRKEEFIASTVRHPMRIETKTGVKKDGTLVGKQIRIVQDCGAYCDVGDFVLLYACLFSSGPYRIPNVDIEGVLVYTNKQIGGAMRAFGTPQVAFAHESDMDIIAEKLGLDPVELRRRNLIEEGDHTVTGQRVEWSGPGKTLDAVVDKASWQSVSKKSYDDKKKRGRGIACGQYASGALNMVDYSSATLKMNEDGSVNVSVSNAELGQGVITVLSQIVAEELGLSLEEVSISGYDTETTPLDTIGANASRSTFICGRAVLIAAEKARIQLVRQAAQFFEANNDDIELKDRMAIVKSAPDKCIPVADLCRISLIMHGEPIVSSGFYKTQRVVPMDLETGQGKPVDHYVYGTSLAEVEVDEETGNVKVLSVVSAHDVGKAINPKLVEGQFEGGIVMGMGYALSEEILTIKGETLNPNFHDYKIPTPLDIPSITSVILEGHGSEGPFGAKGVGEPPIIPVAAAVANAIYDAIGVRIRDLPISPEKIVLSLKSKDQKGARNDSSSI